MKEKRVSLAGFVWTRAEWEALGDELQDLILEPDTSAKSSDAQPIELPPPKQLGSA